MINFKRNVVPIAILTLSFITTGCVQTKNIVRAFIEPTPGWEMKEFCGYQGCYPMVDALIGNEATIRIEVVEAQELYEMRMMFSYIKQPLVLDTTKVKGIAGSATVNAKIFYCNSPWNYLSKRTALALKHGISITNDECLLLLFDHPAFLTEKKVAMDMSEALLLDGKPLNVPLVSLVRASKPEK